MTKQILILLTAFLTLRSSTLLFPKSANIYDSYGEALLQCGKKEEAVTMYKKSLELHPENTNVKEVLAKIEGGVVSK